MSRQVILIAKRVHEKGCIAFQTVQSQHLAELVTQLGHETIDHGIDILTVSSTALWGEYGPYSFVESETEFVEKNQGDGKKLNNYTITKMGFRP